MMHSRRKMTHHLPRTLSKSDQDRPAKTSCQQIRDPNRSRWTAAMVSLVNSWRQRLWKPLSHQPNWVWCLASVKAQTTMAIETMKTLRLYCRQTAPTNQTTKIKTKKTLIWKRTSIWLTTRTGALMITPPISNNQYKIARMKRKR